MIFRNRGLMMTPQSRERVRRGLERCTALQLRVEATTRDGELLVTLTDVDPRESFMVYLRLGYQRVEAELHLGSFASGLLREMSRATMAERAAFRGLAEAVGNGGASVVLTISGQQYSAEEPGDWPSEWSEFSFKIVRAALDVGGMSSEERDRQLEKWGTLALLMGMALAAQEEDDELPPREAGLPEGARTTITVNRFERSRQNRQRCLAIHGHRCTVCELDLRDTYGDLGDGFIHVHHVTPVSKIGPDYLVDPVRDLVPVCPNCHAMLHRKDPPLSPDNLRLVIRAVEGSHQERDV